MLVDGAKIQEQFREKSVCAISPVLGTIRSMLYKSNGCSELWRECFLEQHKRSRISFNFQPSVPLVLHKKDLKNSSGLVVFRTLEIKFHNSVDEGCRN